MYEIIEDINRAFESGYRCGFDRGYSERKEEENMDNLGEDR